MLVCALVAVHLFLLVHGFLLDTNGQQSDQYLTVSELDKRLALLTEQVTHKLTLLKKEIHERNDTTTDQTSWEQKYRTLQGSYDRLKSRVDALQTKYDSQETELILMKSKLSSTSPSASGNKVLLKSCAYKGSYIYGGIVKFRNVNTHLGVSNPSAFISSGKFICEKTGLYLVSVSIASSTAGARYFVIQDGAPVSFSFVSSDNSTDSGTVVTAIELQANNTVWIEAQDSLDLYLGWSCLTIVRLQ